jgi:hypothetical protein
VRRSAEGVPRPSNVDVQDRDEQSLPKDKHDNGYQDSNKRKVREKERMVGGEKTF